MASLPSGTQPTCGHRSERSGSGPALILVGGAFNARRSAADLVPLLSTHFTVYANDRRGRGDSKDIPPYRVEREVEDLNALAASPAATLGCTATHRGGALVLKSAAGECRRRRSRSTGPRTGRPTSKRSRLTTPRESTPQQTPVGGKRWPRSSLARQLARDVSVDELAQQPPLVRFAVLTLVRVGGLRSAGFRLGQPVGTRGTSRWSAMTSRWASRSRRRRQAAPAVARREIPPAAGSFGWLAREAALVLPSAYCCRAQ